MALHTKKQCTYSPKMKLRVIALSVCAMFILGGILFTSRTHAAKTATVQLLDAKERGVTKHENTKGIITPTFDEAVKKDVIEVNYAVPQGEKLEIWTRNYPETLSQDSVNTLALGMILPQTENASLHIVLELRGAQGTQEITPRLQPGWSVSKSNIDWQTIGAIKEVVVVVQPKEGFTETQGTLSFALTFLYRETPVASTSLPRVEQAPAEAPAPTIPAETKAVVAAAPSASMSIQLFQAKERGISPEGPAKGTLVATVDEVVNKDILECDYTIEQGSSLRLWANTFPETLTRENIDTLRVGVRLSQPEQAQDLQIVCELFGTKSTQTFPLTLKCGWNSFQESIDWDTIGNLEELAFIITPTQAVETTKGTLSFAAAFVLKGVSSSTQTIEALEAPYRLLDAGEKGVFNIGPGQGNTTTPFDDTLGRDVWEFTYSIPKGSIIGIWTKSFPKDINARIADAARIAIFVPTKEALKDVAVTVEIKGDKNLQRLPVSLSEGWNFTRTLINWNTIGALQEVVFVVSPISGGDAPVTGALRFDLDFYQLSFIQKNLIAIKIGLVIIIGLLIAFLARIASIIFGQKRTLFSSNAEPLSGIKRDFFYGVMVVLLAGCAMSIYSLGKISALEAGLSLNFLVIAVLGTLIAELSKTALTGKHLTTTEVLQNALLSGLIAASSSMEELLQAPATWMQIFTVTNLTAMLTFIIYHCVNMSSLSSKGKHISPIAGSLLVSIPYMFGLILLLENAPLLSQFSNMITVGALAAWPLVLETMGRVIVIFLFNEAVTNAIALATKGKCVEKVQSHLYLLLMALGAALSPLIADLGSMASVGTLPEIVRALIAIATTMLSFGGLWGEVYLLTGIALDAGKRIMPTDASIAKHVTTGVRKGMAYSGILMAILYVLHMILRCAPVQAAMAAQPLLFALIAGALVFPFIKTIIESFDGSMSFFERAQYSYTNATLYFRGALVGFGFAYMITQGMFEEGTKNRILLGTIVGFLASAGVSFGRDVYYASRKQGKIQSWRLYFVDACLGIFVGSALAFYLDARQVPVIVEKFKLYTSAGFSGLQYITYPLVNKWGRIDLGMYTGGSKLIYLESLAGVINWSIAAWLFAINKVFLQAFFEKDSSPIKFFFSKAGFATLVEHMIYVLRWGLWMSPIIFTFLRMMPDPTWYNQDGAIRTLCAIFNNFTMSPEAFRQWSMNVFIYVLAFDFFRILIWMDHMGLRVATLVNLSFIGMERLDEKTAKFIGSASAQRYIPEGVKRFTTWGPLLIPFYIPRGEEWDYAWNTALGISGASQGGFIETIKSLALPQLIALIAMVIIGGAGVSALLRVLQARKNKRHIHAYEIANREYKVVARATGELYSEIPQKECDVTRRAYDLIDPSGRVLFIVDTTKDKKNDSHFWPVCGNFPHDLFDASRITQQDNALTITNTSNGIKTTIVITLPDMDTTAEHWSISVENLTDRNRTIKVIPYLEWVLNGWMHDRFHTQYARLYPEMTYLSAHNTMLSWQKSTKAMGFMATDIAPEGFLTSRVDFIGRARSLWSPRVFETFDFLAPKDTDPYPTFDPIGSFLIPIEVGARSTQSVNMVIGYAKNKDAALKTISRFVKAQAPKHAIPVEKRKRPYLIGHGEIPPGTPQPYSVYTNDGNTLTVRTPFTPRPIDHAVSNAIHSVMVTNRGLHTSCNGNSQQNRVTPDWPDTVTKEIPAEAIYLYEPDTGEWSSPTYHPLNQATAKHECDFSVDGTAVFKMTKGDLATELTVFVPEKDPMGVYLLTIKNNANRSRTMRVAPYFHMCLSFQPERSGPLVKKHNKSLDALFFSNPRNIFRTGWAFASLSIPADATETKRGRFFGEGRGVMHPFMVEQGRPDDRQLTDEGQVAAFVGTVTIPARGECTIAVVLGQADSLKEATDLVQKYKDMKHVEKSLAATRAWWLGLMSTAEIKTSHADFNHLQNWLKYQALAERIWPRRGFYQTSGAFGFRDQLQDTVNLMWVDPALARKQIILHASQQFLQGDVFHWFFTLVDGRTAFSCRSHASDNPLWLSWSVAEYVRATGDETILDEMTSYVYSEFPFGKLPKNKHGWGHLYNRITRADSVYRHAMRSIDLVIKDRTGKNGLPLIGTGDWNDGLDEIGSEGRGESIWLGFFLYYILREMLPIIERKDGSARKAYYEDKMKQLAASLEKTWREDRYLRAIHDDGTEIGIKGSGVWEIDALTAAWAVMSGINFERGVTIFNTALSILEKGETILLGWPALREDTKPYLGRSSKYPEGVRENGMYCHGVQWLIRAARILAESFEQQGEAKKAQEYRETASRLWMRISPIAHVTPQEIEIYGGQPNKQSADFLTKYDSGRMIWHGYTGAAGWMLRQAFEGIVGARLVKNEVIMPTDLDKARGPIKVQKVHRDIRTSPFAKK